MGGVGVFCPTMGLLPRRTRGAIIVLLQLATQGFLVLFLPLAGCWSQVSKATMLHSQWSNLQGKELIKIHQGFKYRSVRHTPDLFGIKQSLLKSHLCLPTLVFHTVFTI